jgi:putative ABC transport system permease protein
MKFRRRFTQSGIFVFIIIFTISLFVSLGTNTVQTLYENTAQFNQLISAKAIGFKVNQSEKISGDQLMDVIKSKEDICLIKDQIFYGIYTGKAIFYNYEKNMQVPMMSGRFLNKNDFGKNKPLIVIGKDMKDEVIVENGESYINYNNEMYKVIGIMGYNNRSSILDNTFYINLDYFLSKYKNLQIINSPWLLDGKVDETETLFNDLNKDLNSNNKVNLTKTEVDRAESSISKALYNRKFTIITMIVTMLVIGLNIFNITYNYIANKRKEIGIKKALGGINFMIALDIICEFEIICLISFLFSQAVYFTVIKLGMLNQVFGGNVYFLSGIVTLVLVILITLIISLIPIRRTLKIDISDAMKGI